VIGCGCRGNDAPADPNMAVFVRPPRWPASTRGVREAYNFSFPTLLHFPRELLLTGNDLGEATVVIVKMVQRETLRREKDLEKRGNVKFLRKIVRLRPILI